MDKKKTSRWQGRRPTTRRLVQLYAALLYNANLKGFAAGEISRSRLKSFCVPGLNCYSCPGAVGACPLGALQNALSVSGHRAPFYVLGILMLFGLTLGRTVCGWLCPMGLIQELLHRIPTPKIRKSRVTRILSCLKYVILAVFVIILPLWYGLARGLPLPAFCKYICPAGTLEGAVALLSSRNNDGLFASLGALFTHKFVIMAVILTACVFCHRCFCRFLCPLGAIYGLFNRIALTGVKVDAGRCSGCATCVRACPMDVMRVGDRECISCGKCMDVCARNAISIRCGHITLVGGENGPSAASPQALNARKKRGRILWACGLSVLLAALAWFNVLEPAGRQEQAPEPAQTAEWPGEKPDESPPADAFPSGETSAAAAPGSTGGVSVGFQVGQQLPDFEIDTLDGGHFHLQETRGQAVFINLWATYCAPCVQELSYFEQLKQNHPDAEILAVHSGFVTEDVAAYLSGRGWDSLRFAVDDEAGDVFAAVNGSTKLPQTIVLNRRGEVIYSEIRSVTPEMLETLYETAAAE